jgi:hypothetical protein
MVLKTHVDSGCDGNGVFWLEHRTTARFEKHISYLREKKAGRKWRGKNGGESRNMHLLY